MSATSGIFASAGEFSLFNSITSQTSVPSRVLSIEEFNSTPVELLWYYEITKKDNKRSIKWDENVVARQLADIETVRKSLAAQVCSIECIEALVRLSTSSITASKEIVLTPDIPHSAVEPSRIMSSQGVAQPKPESVPAKGQDSGILIMKYCFLCAYLLRYAFRLPGDNWEMEMIDFKSKFSDMLGHDFDDATPSNQWAVSFNRLANNLKHKARIVIYMVINTCTMIDSRSPIVQKMFKYLFSTPFSFYGLPVLVQIRRCADSLDITIDRFMNALNVTELQTGVLTIRKTLESASKMPWWMYARAFDDSFLLSEMSSLSIKRLHFVCLCILKMKGGQGRFINLDAVKSLAMVRDRELLKEVAAKILAAIDMKFL